MCPAAEQLLGQLVEQYGPERVVPIAFHVDYFNEPWEDPFSQEAFSRREYQYSLLYTKANKIKDENYLFFTPMLMVDGRTPMLGSDRAKAGEAIRRALESKPGVSIGLALGDGSDERHRTLEVTLSRPASAFAGKEVLVGVVITEDPVTTKVGSGENGGKTLTEHFAARRLEVKAVRLDRSKPTTLAIPLAIEAGWDASRCLVAVYVQDETTGRMLQAATRRWAVAKGSEPGRAGSR